MSEREILVIEKESPKDYLAQLTGPDDKWKFKRVFVKNKGDKIVANDDGFYEARIGEEKTYYQILNGKLFTIEKSEVIFD